MTKGLITRIGEWMDRKWEAKSTWRDLEKQEETCAERYVAALASVSDTKTDIWKEIELLNKEIKRLNIALASSTESKEVADLKTRFEKLELYLGMSRKVDPTKPAVAKSAFAM